MSLGVYFSLVAQAAGSAHPFDIHGGSHVPVYFSLVAQAAGSS
jgi:hypothetical protein